MSARESPGAIAALSRAFRQHPVSTVVFASIAGLGWLANQHQEVRAALLTMLANSFAAVPSGWLLMLVAGLGWRVWVLGGQVRNCHDERIEDRRRWEQDRREDRRVWEIDRAGLEQKVVSANEMVTDLFERLANGREAAEQDRRQQMVPVPEERRQRRPRAKVRKPPD